MMKEMGNTLTDQEVRDIMKEAGSMSSISYSAFCRLVGSGIKLSRDVDPEDELRDAFRLFDLDNDGQISPKDMVGALAHFGVTLTDREVDQVYAVARHHVMLAAIHSHAFTWGCTAHRGGDFVT